MDKTLLRTWKRPELLRVPLTLELLALFETGIPAAVSEGSFHPETALALASGRG